MTQGSFDEFASDYDAALQEGISATGEDKDFFARGRVARLAEQLLAVKHGAASVMDFGCGTGSATPYLLDLPGVASVVGVDVSERSLEEARNLWGSPRAQFLRTDQFGHGGSIDLAFCNGVFHHIPVPERRASALFVHAALRPGGLFAFWENNPWNPGTRYVMSRCPFDQDAIMLRPAEARQLLCSVGFEILSTTYAFIFPRLLRSLRPLEPLLARWPLGGQYQIICQRK